MSAEKPEVGDIWKRGRNVYYLHSIYDFQGDIKIVALITKEKLTVSETIEKFHSLNWFYTYIGKSKHPLESIFEVI